VHQLFHPTLERLDLRAPFRLCHLSEIHEQMRIRKLGYLLGNADQFRRVGGFTAEHSRNPNTCISQHPHHLVKLFGRSVARQHRKPVIGFVTHQDDIPALFAVRKTMSRAATTMEIPNNQPTY
jgi:hypothetical protein